MIWTETQGSRRIRDYREVARTGLYIELQAQDGCGYAFRLYKRTCQGLTNSGGWEDRATGYWTR